MRMRFPEWDFDARLLSRILQKGFELRFGNGPDAISRLMDLGNHYRKDGGIFEYRIGSDMRLEEVVVAKKSMLPYIQEFGDFLINDGTHGCDVYGMILMVNTLVDSLGKSVMAGYSHFRSEQADHIIRSLIILGLNSAGTMMTDEGLAYPLVGEKLQKRHILCVQHYQQQIVSACNDLAGALSDWFKRATNSAIIEDLGSDAALDSHQDACRQRYTSPSALKFIEKLSQDCEKYAEHIPGKLSLLAPYLHNVAKVRIRD